MRLKVLKNSSNKLNANYSNLTIEMSNLRRKKFKDSNKEMLNDTVT